MKKKIIILGSKGAVASQLIKTFKEKKLKNFLSLDRKKLNIINKPDNLKKFIKRYKPTHIINCLAITGLVKCEKNIIEAYEINSFFPLKLAEMIFNKKIQLIHFSTDAVFDGLKNKKIYCEKDKPNPKSIYGKSKYLADKLINSYKNVLIIRLPLLFGPTNKNQIIAKLTQNLLLNKKTYASIDIYSTPVYTPNLASFILSEIILKGKFKNKKLIHFTSNKYLSIYGLIQKISKNLKKSHLVSKVKDNYFKSEVKKPKNLGLRSVLKYNNYHSEKDYKNI